MLKHALKPLLLLVLFLIAGSAEGQVTASFKASDTAGCFPLIVRFTSTSVGATTYSWDLGNGTPGSADTASTAYTAIGTYTVTLTASNGGTSSVCSLIIRVYGPPVISFAANDTTVCPGVPILFTNTTIANAWGAVTYTWNFGDGGSSGSKSPSYSYTTPGKYNTALYAVNSKGCVSSKLKSSYISIFDAAKVNYHAVTSYFCTAPGVDSFVNTSTGVPPLTYAWNFGDGVTSTVKSPLHTYSVAGHYIARLAVTDSNGCVDTSVHRASITIGSLKAGFSSKSSACIKAAIAFTDTSSSHIAGWWDFGDGATDSAETPIHRYSAVGSYNVKRRIFDGICYDSVTHVVNIIQPKGYFTVSQPCTPYNTLMFTATSPGNTVTWDFGDLHTAAGTTATHTYKVNPFTPLLGDIKMLTMVVEDSVGCVNTYNMIDTLFNPFLNLLPTFPTSGCVPLGVDFGGIAYSQFIIPKDPFQAEVPYPFPIASYLWDFGDGSPKSTLPTPHHVYTAVGIYVASCHAVTSNGCAIDSTDTIKVGTPQVASGYRTPSKVCAGTPVYFVSTSPSPLIDDLKWGFGDGGNDEGVKVKHRYKQAGVYKAQLLAFYHGCPSDSAVFFQDTVQSPGADIAISYTCIPNTGMVFIDSSRGDDERRWDFGDGSPASTLANPVHFFPKRDLYTVTLTTHNFTTGCRDTTTYQTKYLPPPYMDIYTADPKSICRDQADTITSSVVYGHIGYECDTNYYFIGPDTVSERSFKWYDNWVPIDSTHYTLINSFHTTGLHTIAFVIMDNHGCYDTLADTNYILVAKPVDSFKFTPAVSCAPLTSSFLDKTTDAPGMVITNYLWSFGDGATDARSVPTETHSYTAAGTFSITEITVDNLGCSDTFTSHFKNVVHRPTAAFAASSNYSCAGATISFSNFSSGGLKWYWSFGDGTTSTLSSPSHTYTAAGIYYVKFATVDGYGCTDTTGDGGTIQINPVPKASFYMDDSFAVCPPLSIHFTNTSTGGATNSWSFGDGTFSSATDPADIYLTPDNYKVKLTVDNIYGCTDTAVGHAVVFGYAGAFTYTPLSVCGSSPVHFKATVSHVTSIVWDFNDGITSGLSLADTASHIYATHGTYLPKLILTDTNGCTNFSVGVDTIKADTITAGFTINPNPVCVNSSVTFTDTSTSYYSTSSSWLWTFGSGVTNTSRSPSYSYSVSGTHPVTLKVTDKSGCTSTVTENVVADPLPPAITGPTTVCSGLTIALSDPAGTGTWLTANTAIATIGAGSGILTGVSPGTTTVTYRVPVGCPQYESVQVDSLPYAISGVTTVCAGLTTTLSTSSKGGTWLSSNTAIATIAPSTGLLTGIATGTATITYKLPTGCVSTATVNVAISPLAITGPAGICTGSAYSFSDAVGGGTWTSSNSSMATVDPALGIVSGVAAGAVTISYSLSSGCVAARSVTVVTMPSAISGKDSVCVGSKIALSDASGGGVWSSSSTAAASVGSLTGLVNGLAGGVVLISYTESATCAATLTVTVNAVPLPITGVSHLCTGLPSVLSDATPAGVWSSTSPSVTVDAVTGSVDGISVGTAIISYALSTGCQATKAVTVTLSPPAIAGPNDVCVGFNIFLTDPATGGTWSSSNTGIAKIGGGTVLGFSAGTATISYTLAGCPALAVLTVNPLPAAISGSSEVCQGGTITLSDLSAGGTWESFNSTVSVGKTTGVILGVSGGAATITYTLATGCQITKIVTVNPLPRAISGSSDVCIGLTTSLTDAGGGTWGSSNPLVATVGVSTGIVKGVAFGSATITFSPVTGCFATKTITVDPLPASITGVLRICAGSTTILSDASAGGAWSSSNTAVVAFDPGTGIVLGVSGGSATVTYMLPTSCFSVKTIIVDPLPGAITGATSICVGHTTVLADFSSGGSWKSSNTGVATIGAGTGVVTGIASGTAIVTYTLATGCVTTKMITVNPLPSAISGIASVCQGQTTTLADIAAGGTWSSGNTSVATVDAGSGVVSGVNGGTAIITYLLATGCSATITVTVTQQNAAITGVPAVCRGAATKLADITPNGTWSSSDVSIASIDLSGSVTGKSVGTAIITYKAPNTCGAAMVTVTVNPMPDAGTIAGNFTICSGTQELLTDTAKGGIWVSTNQAIATVDGTGLVNALAAGSDSIIYSYTNICGTASTKVALTIHQSPEAVHIGIHPDSVLCNNTLFQNFGASAPEPPGERYIWSAENALVYATSADRQNCLVSFFAAGTGVVKLSTDLLATDCTTTDSLIFSIGVHESPVPVVVYYAPEFVCNDNTADSYQWGYDDVLTLDSTMLQGDVNENYYNERPDFVHKNYWVMTYHKGCMQKSYYNAPEQINGVNSKDNIGILLFPNPADSKIDIRMTGIEKSETIDVQVYDMIGKEVRSAGLAGGSGTIKLAGMAPGVYMTVFRRNGIKIGSKTFVKN